MTGDCCVFKFPQRSVDGKHLMRFQGETCLLKFLWRSVEGTLILSKPEMAFKTIFFLGGCNFIDISENSTTKRRLRVLQTLLFS